VGPIKPKIFFPVGDGNEEEIKRKKKRKKLGIKIPSSYSTNQKE